MAPKRATTGTTAIFISPQKKSEGGVFETLGSLNVLATFRMPREVVGLKSTVVPGCLGGLAVFSELTVEFGCPRRPVAPSNREFPLP